MPAEFELSQGNTNPETSEQKPEDLRIEGVIQELSVSARRLRDPRLLSYSSKPDKSLLAIEYISDDRFNFTGLYGIHYGTAYHSRPKQEPSRSRLYPRKIQEYERLIPISIHRANKPIYSVNDLSLISAWLHLDKNDPAILEISPEGNQVIERSDLLPNILEAVSGKKIEY